jgi:hypothetical protein
MGRVGDAVNGGDFDGPDRKAVAGIVGDVKVGRVAEGDAVEPEVVGVIGDDETADL